MRIPITLALLYDVPSVVVTIWPFASVQYCRKTFIPDCVYHVLQQHYASQGACGHDPDLVNQGEQNIYVVDARALVLVQIRCQTSSKLVLLMLVDK
jgi:hypothetical protein